MTEKDKGYLDFCRKFQRSKIPELKFKKINESYRKIYKKRYKIEEKAINKATMFIFLLIFMIITTISILFIKISIFIIFFYTTIISLIISYQFNVFIYNKIKKAEQVLNSVLYFIKIDFSLLQKISRKSTDFYLKFIYLIANYDIPISNDFKKFISRIHCGNNPEKALRDYITPSADFNNLIKNLLIKNFDKFSPLQDEAMNTLEEDYKIYLKEITTKLSILFFIGIFVPIGLSFSLFFISVSKLVMLLVLPLFLAFINYLFKKFIKKNHFLIGMIKNNSQIEQKKLEEFLLFIEKFALNLKRNFSPEKALLNAYFEEKARLPTISGILKEPMNSFFNGITTISETLKKIKDKMINKRYSIIISSILKMIEESAYYSASKIVEIINIFKNHQNLQKKIKILIKGERFKTFIFLILLPLIIGSIGALIPFLPNIFNNLFEFQELNIRNTAIAENQISSVDIISILITFLITNSISSFYFLSIINYHNKIFIILVSDTIFILTYLLSIINIMNFIM